MRKIYLILVVISFYACNKNNMYLTSELTSNCPKELESFKKENIDSDIKFAKLETGLDSLKIFLGLMTKNNKTDYWISSNFKGSNFLKGISLKDSLEFLTGDLTIEINPFDQISPYKVSLKVLHNPMTNKVEYLWLNNGLTNNTASLIKVEKPIQQEKKFPEININSISGEPISTKDFKDKIVVINWWSTGCAPCRKEIPELNEIYEKYKSNKEILFLAITSDKKESVSKFLEKHEFKYVQGFGDKDINKIFEDFQPQNIIIDKKGITKFFLAGYLDQTPLFIEKTIEQLLTEKQ
ncbi:TlpA family protein disulfide reductase [Flavobacteriaceae bacterium XHP0103]|uniref:TlpA family protein disulfide reductase n=1 Tax=Marixanthotalea marina TaxID=2844359 RepID=UPI002989F5EE|nr:TlpA disulfide reductase family protein [Marixanthotalea marina]MBU3822517.1 TlpA family protein disulfide reductase [Marixanthotalea marina]